MCRGRQEVGSAHDRCRGHQFAEQCHRRGAGNAIGIEGGALRIFEQHGRVHAIEVHDAHGPVGESSFADLLVGKDHHVLVPGIRDDLVVQRIDLHASTLQQLQKEAPTRAKNARDAARRIMGLGLRKDGHQFFLRNIVDRPACIQ